MFLNKLVCNIKTMKKKMFELEHYVKLVSTWSFMYQTNREVYGETHFLSTNHYLDMKKVRMRMNTLATPTSHILMMPKRENRQRGEEKRKICFKISLFMSYFYILFMPCRHLMLCFSDVFIYVSFNF